MTRESKHPQANNILITRAAINAAGLLEAYCANKGLEPTLSANWLFHYAESPDLSRLWDEVYIYLTQCEFAPTGTFHMLTIIDGGTLPDNIAQDFAHLPFGRAAIQFDLDRLMPL